MISIDVLCVLCFLSLFGNASGTWNCGWGVGTASWQCTKTAAPHPTGVFVASTEPGNVIKDAMELFMFMYVLYERHDGGPLMGKHGQTFYSVPADRIPYRSNAMTNPNVTTAGHCQPDCVADVFAPIGDADTIQVVQHIVEKGWAFWLKVFVMIWGASSNALFDVHCNLQCISVHPSRKKYFQHGIDNIGLNDTVVFISSANTESIEVATPLKTMLVDRRGIKPFDKPLAATRPLKGIASFFNEVDGEISSMLIAANTGDAEQIVIELGKSRLRPKRLLVMNTKNRLGYGVPENELDPQVFFAAGMSNKLFQDCTIEPTLHNFGLPSESRQIHSGISRGTLLWQWRGKDKLLTGSLGAMAHRAVGAFQYFSSVDMGYIGWVTPTQTGQFTPKQFLADNFYDDSNTLYDMTHGDYSVDFFNAMFVHIMRTWYAADLDYRFRSYALHVGCAPLGGWGIESLGFGTMFRLAPHNPYNIFQMVNIYVSGTREVPPEYRATKHKCYSVIGMVGVDLNKGEWEYGMWLQQHIEGRTVIFKPFLPVVWVGGALRNLMDCEAWSTTTSTTTTTSMTANFALPLNYQKGLIACPMLMLIMSRI